MVVNFNEEKKLWKQGYKIVVGLDEAGRGPLAGPVVAAAVMVKFNKTQHSDILENVRMFSGIRDSKKLSARQREFFYKKLTNHENIVWGIGVVSEKVIDKINILEATKLAMQKSLDNISAKMDGRPFLRDKAFLILDGNFLLPSRWPSHRGSSINLKNLSGQKSIIKGDEKIFSCTAAGIIAKVTRDNLMMKNHAKYPEYGFDRHKGYGTILHIKNLQNFGPCQIHRKSFSPLSLLSKLNLSDKIAIVKNYQVIKF